MRVFFMAEAVCVCKQAGLNMIYSSFLVIIA